MGAESVYYGTHYEMWQSAVKWSDNLWAAYHVYQVASSWHRSLWSPAAPRLWTTGPKVTLNKMYLTVSNTAQIGFHKGFPLVLSGWEMILLWKKRNSPSVCIFLWLLPHSLWCLVAYSAFGVGIGEARFLTLICTCLILCHYSSDPTKLYFTEEIV